VRTFGWVFVVLCLAIYTVLIALIIVHLSAKLP
jgi:hypothetical protein